MKTTPIRHRRTVVIASLIAIAASLISTHARADFISSTLLMHTVDQFNGNVGAAAKYTFDAPMLVYTPNCAEANCVPNGNLALFLHGHPDDPSDGKDFLPAAAAEGFHGISLDFDYGRDSGTIDNAPRKICGCYTNCYEQLHKMILDGSSHFGIPAPHYSVNDRLKAVLLYLWKGGHGSGWGQYLTSVNNGADYNINWAKITIVGFSRGSSIGAVLMKEHPAKRLIMISGDHDQLVNGDWAGTSGTNINSPTSYRYGAANNIGDCIYPAPGPNVNYSPAYWTDGILALKRDSIYAYSNEDDTRAPYDKTVFAEGWGQVSYGTMNNLLYLWSGVLTAHALVGNYTTGEITGWQTNSPHWLTPGPGTTLMGTSSPQDACGTPGSNAHVDTVNSYCANAGADTLQADIWFYLLKHNLPN